MEFWHPSWHNEAVFALLEKYGVACCIMSGTGLPCILRTMAPFVYVRMHGRDPYIWMRVRILRKTWRGGQSVSESGKREDGVSSPILTMTAMALLSKTLTRSNDS